MFSCTATAQFTRTIWAIDEEHAIKAMDAYMGDVVLSLQSSSEFEWYDVKHHDGTHAAEETQK
jgi:hypothetical protein